MSATDLKGVYSIMNTHREKAPSNKTPALTESMDMDLGSWYIKSTLFY